MRMVKLRHRLGCHVERLRQALRVGHEPVQRDARVAGVADAPGLYRGIEVILAEKAGVHPVIPDAEHAAGRQAPRAVKVSAVHLDIPARKDFKALYAQKALHRQCSIGGYDKVRFSRVYVCVCRDGQAFRERAALHTVCDSSLQI